MNLSDAERSELEDRGYFVRRSVFAAAECDALCHGLSQYIVRTARDTRARGRVAPFWEAFAASATDNQIFWDPCQSKLLDLPDDLWEPAVMRVGHVLHRIAPFDALARDPRVAQTLTSAIGAPAEIAQSSIIYKQPSSDLVQFGWHQDSSYLPNEPESLVLAFVALDDMNEENGALEVLPGSHKLGLQETHRLTADGFVSVRRRGHSVDGTGGLLLPLPRGSMVVVHGRTLHASKPNRSAAPRRALIVHGKARTSVMAADCWSRGPFDALDGGDPPRAG